jgi:protein required for attachment to host cells
MIETGMTWVVAADGAQARLFEEPRRAGPLRERPDWALRQEPADWPRAVHPAATVHQRTGAGRHAGKEAKPSREAERRFLLRVAEQLEAAAARHEFERLVLMAPPRALGMLRGALSPGLKARVEASDPHDRVDADAARIRQSLRDLRAAIPAG